MKNNNITLFISLIFLTFSYTLNLKGQILIGNTEVDTHSVVTGLDTPWEIIWGPDNHIWITERYGKVSRLNPETGKHDHLLTIPEVHEQSESGLLGMALHPDFPDTPSVFLVYNYYSGGIKERVVRYHYSGSSLEDPEILLDGIGGASNHDGSRLVVDDNYKLFVTTGDATNTSTSQDLSSLSGKILRMNLDGSIPQDNPLSGSYLWTWGHRNPQGLVIAPDGTMYSSEHGPNNDDELNLIEKGRNYGWPDVQGFCNYSSEITYCNDWDVHEPLYAWTPTLAVAGIDYYNSDVIPEWKNSILMATLKEQELVSLSLSHDGLNVTKTSKWFDGWFGRLRDVCIAPDGSIFLAVSNRDGRGQPVNGDDRIVRIKAKQVTGNQIAVGMHDHINLFPNPVRDFTTIQLVDEIRSGNIMVYNLSGELIFTDMFSGREYLLQTGDFNKGYYILKISDGKFNTQVSLIVH